MNLTDANEQEGGQGTQKMGSFLRGRHKKVGAQEALPKGRGKSLIGMSLLSLLGTKYSVRRKGPMWVLFAAFFRGQLLFLEDGEQRGFPFRIGIAP